MISELLNPATSKFKDDTKCVWAHNVKTILSNPRISNDLGFFAFKIFNTQNSTNDVIFVLRGGEILITLI